MRRMPASLICLSTRTGKVRKNPIGERDVEIVLNLLREVGPSHVFVAGDLSDPHGTHRMCYSAITSALSQYTKVRDDAAPDPTIWLYRGAWQGMGGGPRGGVCAHVEG